MPTFAFPNDGALAERLGTGLQNLLQRFDSARHLKKMPLRVSQGRLLYKFDTELILNYGSSIKIAFNAVETLKAVRIINVGASLLLSSLQR